MEHRKSRDKRQHSLTHKAIRTVGQFFPVSRKRGGKCGRCGACCLFIYKCPFLGFDEQGLSACKIYHLRPPVCRKYPRVKHEHLTEDVCGFFFHSHDSGKPRRDGSHGETGREHGRHPHRRQGKA